MSIDGSQFIFAKTTTKRAPKHGVHSDQCNAVRHFKCRDKTCCCTCHTSEIPRLAPRVVEEAVA